MDSLTAFVQEAVVPGNLVRTDGWDGYGRLDSIGYTHTVVRKSFAVEENALKLAHLVASLVKRWLLGTHQGAVSHEHPDYYLGGEFVFRFNRRASAHRGKQFFRFLQNAVLVEAMPYRSMVMHVRERRAHPVQDMGVT